MLRRKFRSVPTPYENKINKNSKGNFWSVKRKLFKKLRMIDLRLQSILFKVIYREGKDKILCKQCNRHFTHKRLHYFYELKSIEGKEILYNYDHTSIAPRIKVYLSSTDSRIRT